MALWPMGLVLLGFLVLWQWSGWMDRRTARWERAKRRDDFQPRKDAGKTKNHNLIK